MSIARYFGPDATYDAIKSFFAKEVSKVAGQLRTNAPNHRGSGRGVPAISSAGPSRPRHLYFDDEDLSVLTEREVELVEARFGQSLRAPAKRPRVMKTSPRASATIDLSGARADSEIQLVEQTINAPCDGQLGPASITAEAGPSSRSTAPSDTYHTATEGNGCSRKRPFSAVEESIESRAADTHHSESPPQISFGYVTNHGQYRCALCLSQLPTQEDLNRHEQISKEHLRNMQDAIKVAQGREKLGQVTTVPDVGRHHNTPAPMGPIRCMEPTGKHERRSQWTDVETSGVAAQADVTSIRQETPLDTIEVRRRSISSVPLQHNVHKTVSQAHPETSNNLGQGQGRAVSLASPFPPASRQPRGKSVQTPSVPMLETRPTTARTEIGTLYTPRTTRKDSSEAPVPRQAAAQQHTQNLEAKLKGNSPAFSATEIADIMRSTELIVQLMGCVQREAAQVAKSQSGSASFDSTSNGNAAASGGVQTVDAAAVLSSSSAESSTLEGSTSLSSLGGSNSSINGVPKALTAPGIEVYSGMRRHVAPANDKRDGKGKARQQDTGTPVSFILVD